MVGCHWVQFIIFCFILFKTNKLRLCEGNDNKHCGMAVKSRQLSMDPFLNEYRKKIKNCDHILMKNLRMEYISMQQKLFLSKSYFSDYNIHTYYLLVLASSI